jgi:hypothetical protein
MRRAFRAWRGEHRVWMRPGLSEVRRWARNVEGIRFVEMALPSEHFDRVDVVHVDVERRAYAPARQLRFLHQSRYRVPERFYLKWLNADLALYLGQPSQINMEVPTFGEDVSFESRNLNVAPCSIMSSAVVDDRLVSSWPPPGRQFPESISADAESQAFYGEARYDAASTPFAGGVDIPLAKTSNDASGRIVPMTLRWEEPFDECFFNGGGLDVLRAHAKLRRLVGEAQAPGAHAEAQEEAGGFISLGWSTQEKTSFVPIVAAEGEQNALFELALKIGVDVEDPSDVWDDPDYRQFAQTTVQVTRAWGWLGYFWYEFLQDLERSSSFRRCELCGSAIVGSSRKRFCSESDNLGCYRHRRSQAKRKERERSSKSVR